MAVKIAINGFGRIGRLVLRGIIESGRTDVVPVAINDLGSVEDNAHLLSYDSVHGRLPADVAVGQGGYAQRLSDEWLAKERDAIKDLVASADVLILAALIPGPLSSAP